MKNRWTLAALMIVAGLVAVAVALSPSAALAKEFKFAGPPAFTVTYPDAFSQDSENPNKVLLRTKKEGGLPIMEIQCMDAPAGLTATKLGSWAKNRYEKLYSTAVSISSDKPATLKDGTPCTEVSFTWMYQGFLSLETFWVGTIKDGKLVYVALSQSPSTPNWDTGRSLTFKK